MKNLLLIMTVLCMLYGGNVLACPGGTFTSQASIDNFPISNPGCTIVTSPIIVGSLASTTNITNLNGFAGITQIFGGLSIFNNPLLTNLSGLAALKSIEPMTDNEGNEYVGLFYFNRNSLITNLSGLGALERVPEMEFTFNNNLTSLSGLNSLKSVARLSLIGLKLANLTGMPALDSCATLYISDNSLLTSLNGFPQDVPNLRSITMLNNPLLASADIARGTTVLNVLEVGNNPLLANLSDFSDIQSFGRIAVSFIGGLKSFEGLDACTNIGILFVGGPVPGFLGLENVTRIGSFYLNGTPTNTAYRSFNGLGAVKSIGRWELGGTTIDNFSGLASLESVREFEFNGINITTLSGLANLNPDSITRVSIHDSPALTQCNVNVMCVYLASPTAVSNILNNGAGCSSKDEIVNSPACTVVLPVTFVFVQARKVAEGNKLSWQTASEINNKGFEIERSTDGRLFTSIGYMAGNGDTQHLKNYSFTDTQPMPDCYYRLKQWDWDGSFQYSKIVAVIADHAMAVAYPNPAGDFVFIRNATNYSPVSIKNVQGFSVSESRLMPDKPIDTKSLSNGLYMISVGDKTLKVWVNH